MRSYIKINSCIPAIIIGFLSFYVLFIRWDIPWEIGFIIAFTLGYLTTGILKLCIGKISQTELDEHEAKKVIDIVSDFEKDG